MSPAAPRRPAPPATIPAAMAGAVDLAAVRARNEAAARAAEAPVPAAGAYVVEVTEATFQTEVLDRSFQVPVLIDLWAEWCQPCKQLSPILERLANESGGAWVLAKIDVDANPRISQALQVQSIPTVFAVIGGQLAPGFQGALPEAQVRQFVDAVIDAGRESKLPGMPPGGPGGDAAGGAQPVEPGMGEAADAVPGPPEDARLVAAEDALEAGDFDTAVARYQEVVAAEPGNEEARLALGQARLLQRVAGYPSELTARAQNDPNDVPGNLAAADLQFAGNQIDSALERLVGLLARTSAEDRDAVRERLIEY
ncbi:MAG TPA: tetratricopeptide repeat protein, partial [Jatrophihabitantaceae bacterium]